MVYRVAKKIPIVDFLTQVCLESQKGSPSYNDLASRIETTCKISPSKQAISKKFNSACVRFFQSVLAYIIKSKLPKSELDTLKPDSFNRILVQDSTIIKLPQRLFKTFSGVSNGSSSVCNARIQGVYDLISGSFISFSIDSYSKNDLVAAPELQLSKGDLTLRDRGYYTNSEMNRHIDADADFIYRFKYNTTYYDPKTGLPINLNKLLKRNSILDMEVCLNADCLVKVRLVAAPVSNEIANQRKMKAKKESRGHQPSEGLLRQMAWSIFITTIPKEQADFNKILTIYSLRWRIEIIFKSWKSHMSFSKLHNVSENQLRVILTARFIMIVICTHNIYNPCYERIYKNNNRQLSLLKLFRYLMSNPEKILEILVINSYCNKSHIKALDDALLKYCAYDNRNRPSYTQVCQSVMS